MPTTPTRQEMAEQLDRLYERLWFVAALIDPAEYDEGVMPDGWPPKVLLGQIAAWNTIHTRRMIKLVRPEHSSFIEKVNGGLLEEEALARLRAREPMRAAVEAKIPLDAVVAELEKAQSWSLDLLRDDESELALYLAGEPDPRVYLIGNEMMTEMSDRVRTLRRWAGSMDRWSKRDLLALLEQQHELLMESVAGLDEATILNTITHKPWSMRDELVHILAWNELELYIIDHWPAPNPEEVKQYVYAEAYGEDEVNDVLLAERAHLTMIDVVDGLATVHRRIMKRLEAADDATLRSEGDWLFGASGELSNFAYAFALHQAEHSESLWKARQRLEA